MNYEPLIKGIADMIRATGKAAGEGKATEGTVKGAVQKASARTPVEVERWLGSLSAPEKQVPLIHDYLRGHSALSEAKATGATHVREISTPIWESTQRHLQQKIDADPEVAAALKDIYLGVNTPKAPGLTTVPVVPEKQTAHMQSLEVPSAPAMPQAKPDVPKKALDTVARKQRGDAWNEFAVSIESQDPVRTESALQRIKALQDTETVNTKPGQTPDWQKGLDYMASLEVQLGAWREAGVRNEEWTANLLRHREASGIDMVPLPKEIRTTIDRFEAWADAQKPATMQDRVGQVLGVPRAVMSSADLSAPGRQGLLMISRPEYWQNLKPMVEAWSPEKYLESQAYIRNHPDYHAATEAGLALTDLHSKLAPREEAFQSKMAEKIPVLGNLVKASEQAYTTFLNRVRFDVFSNVLKESAAAGVDIADRQFTRSLAEWVNTSTGRGSPKGFDPGILSTVLFSPRLAISRFQTFNPVYYHKMHPFVRQQAIKANLSAAATVFGLVSLAALGGAKVTWDFRNPDAGKIRIGNTRLDLGGGHFQFLRLFTQLATNQKMNSETGKVSELGDKFGAATRLDVLTRFIIGKEAPVASFVTDYLRGKTVTGQPFELTDAMIERTVPLAMQDVYEALRDEGMQGLVYAFPALVGVGVQTYEPTSKTETVPFLGVKGQVPAEQAAEYSKLIEAADSVAAMKALAKTKNIKNPRIAKSVLRSFVRVERFKVRQAWIKANIERYKTARKAGEDQIPLEAPAPTEE